MTARGPVRTTYRRPVVQAALVAALACGTGRDRHSASYWPRRRGWEGAGLGDTSRASPVVAEGRRIVRGTSHMFAL